MKIFILLILFISVTLTDFGNTEIKLSKVSGSTVVLTIHTQNEGTTEGSDLSITNLKLFCGTTPFPITCQSSKQYELSSAGTSIQCSIDTSITSAPIWVLFDKPTIHSTGDTFEVGGYDICCPPPKFGDVSISLVEVEGKKVVIKITPEFTGTTATDDLTISGLTVQSKALTCKPGKIISLEASTGTNIECSTTEEIEAEDGTKVEVTVPVVDNDGNYVIEEITDKVKVYSYVQTSETDKKYSLRAAKPSDEEDTDIMGLVITAQRDEQQSSALVMQRKEANNDFLPSEDTEAFINSDLQNIPMVYTLCGRLATTINSIHDFRCLPLGVESASDAACTLTFRGVETLGDSIAIYDAMEQKLTPLESGMQMSVSGQTQNRYYIVKGLDLREAAEETHLQIFAKGKEITVIASTQEPISSVRCFDTAGRLVYSANPQAAEYRFSLQSAGVYIIDAQTDSDRKTQKVMTK